MAIDTTPVDALLVDVAAVDQLGMDVEPGSGDSDSWEVVASGSISTSLTDTSSITSGAVYKIDLDSVETDTDGTAVTMTIYLSGVEQTSAGYVYQELIGGGAEDEVATPASPASSIPLTSAATGWKLGNAAGEQLRCTIYLFGPSDSSVNSFSIRGTYIDSVGRVRNYRTNGYFTTAGVLDGIKIQGNTLSGNYKIKRLTV